MGGKGWRGRLGPAVAVAPGARVDRFEVFFDLVFVFSFFIITRATAMDINRTNLFHALLVLAVLWWSWVVHSVVATRVRLGEGFVPVLMVAGMAALFTFALALPQAFRDPGENAAGPMVAAGSYVVIRAVHFALYLHVVRDNPSERRYLLRFAPELILSTILLIVAALIPAQLHDPSRAGMIRDTLWATVVVLQYGTGILAGTWGWNVISAEHWTERYDLILIIALGESVISVGVGSNLLGQPPTWPAVAAAVLGIVFTAALWWAHYDWVGPAARIALHASKGRSRVTMARDAYAYLYLPMIAGIIMFALGAEGIVHQVADPHISPAAAPRGPGVPLLFGGVICYLCGNMLFQLRTLHTVSWLRVGTVLLLGASIPVGDHLPGLATLTLLTAICVGLVAVEVLTMGEARAALHEVVFRERTSHEAHEAAYRSRWHEPEPGEPST
ncbi:low temperature requirement protein A [Micromonospora globispora]|uniref:Low temperature requirement protein A n=1 Tax=Micromonospora globispora TaxID=1450148 RepID=A0A317K3S0_9ACTN|nr:low temperature requirement protein A [Micromonospora globispora]PWU46532.1 low temperature requirement protein A [Micromonospora globispora]PWU60310.1 low temperature requirement protein A [Micromonospora globispora]RQW86688.1 low temperature requirement protein A [Micromonospora globispora]